MATSHTETFSNDSFIAINNIPSSFHTADLRAFFADFIEDESFTCFHFRHRPEKVKEKDSNRDGADQEKNQTISTTTSLMSNTSLKQTGISGKTNGNNQTNDITHCCCVAKLKSIQVKLFIDKYDNQNWTDSNNEYSEEVCHISVIQTKIICDSSSKDTSTSNTVDEQVLLTMPELNPPELMPRGNVGTPTLQFLNLIQKCLLPQNLVQKLKLQFPSTSGSRLYSNVSFNYKTKPNLNTSHRPPAKNPRLGNSSTPIKKHENSNCLSSQKPSDHLSLTVSDTPSASDVPPVNQTENEKVDHLPPLSDSSNKDVETVNTDTTDKQIELQIHKVANPRTEKDANNLQINKERQVPQNISKEKSVGSCEFLAPHELTKRDIKRRKKEENKRIRKLMAEGIEERLIAVDKKYRSDEDAEEWDRHEQSEDDPTNQGRNKERLYEEYIDQPWEKGGPGVVFWTDAIYWQQQEGDFDEQTTDDLDVDFSPYEEPGSGDKDIKDFLKIRQETRFRNGYDSTDRFSIGIAKKLNQNNPGSSSSSQSRPYVSKSGKPSKLIPSTDARIGQFENHTKGIGRKVMERQGWQEGQGLGGSRPGIKVALTGEGQRPHNKQGLGYVETQPVQFGVPPVKKTRRKLPEHVISTVYDQPTQVDPKEPLLLRSEDTTLKHRQSMN